MMASKRGYRDIKNFSDDSEMHIQYYGLIARGKRFFISRYTNVDEGTNSLYELSETEAVQILKDWKTDGWSERFIERWIIGTVS